MLDICFRNINLTPLKISHIVIHGIIYIGILYKDKLIKDRLHDLHCLCHLIHGIHETILSQTRKVLYF